MQERLQEALSQLQYLYLLFLFRQLVLQWVEWSSCLQSFGLITIEKRSEMKTRIKELRARYDFTQEDLAKKVGVRRETIVFLEKGKYNPSLKLAHDIARVLKTRIDELFIFEDN